MLLLLGLADANALAAQTRLDERTIQAIDRVRLARVLHTAIVADSAHWRWRDARLFCLSFQADTGRRFFDTAHAAQFRLHRPVVPASACPRTRASMVVVTDSAARATDTTTADAPDPHAISLTLPVGTPGRWIVTVLASHGTAFWETSCRGSDRGRVQCVLTSSGVH